MPAFIGRKRELLRLEAVLGRARSLRSATAIVGGEAGVGKSRLVAAFAERARASGCRVLVGSCLELGERGVPYAPFVEALRALVRSVDPALLPALLGPGRSELGRLLPELDVRHVRSAADEETSSLAQPRLFELYLGLLERLAAEAPLVLVVEDLQWADEATRDLLAFLVRVLRGPGVMFLVTERRDEIATGHPLLPYVAELGRLDQVETVELAPFGRREVSALIRAFLGSAPTDDQVDAIATRTGGNPFFVEQLLVAHREALGRDLPPELRDVLRARIEQLSGGAQDVLRASAAAGAPVDDELLADVLEIPLREVHAALREVVDRQILVRSVGDAPGYVFRHDLLREVVYAELFGGERTSLHAAYARVLSRRAAEAVAQGTRAPSAAQLAYHWDAARDAVRALPASIQAAEEAERVYAFAEARRHLERALELWARVPGRAELLIRDRPDLLQRTAEAAVLSGAFERAVELGRQGLAELGPAAPPERRAWFHERLRWYLYEAGDHAGALEALAEAERLVPEAEVSGARAIILTHRAAIDLFQGRYVRSLAAAEQALAMARATGVRAQGALAAGIVGWDRAMLGDIEGGLALYRQGLTYAEEEGGVEGIALGHSRLAELLDRVGRSDEALAVATAAVERAQRMGVMRTYGGILVAVQADALRTLGRWDEADQVLGDDLDVLPSERAAIALAVARCRLDIGRGRLEEAARYLAEARRLDERVGGTEHRLAVLLAGAELSAAAGRVAEVRGLLDGGVADVPDGPPEPMLGWLAAIGLRAEADAAERARAIRDSAEERIAIGHGREIAERVGELSSRATPGVPVAAEVGVRLAALDALLRVELSRLEGRLEPDAWADAATRHEALGRPYPAAYARFRQGAAILAGRGSRHDAATALRSAHEVTVRLGAEALRAEVELLARQARLDLGTVVGQEDAGADASPLAALGLTGRELEVLRLVAGGWTNQQIADHLFISPKTASVHVSNILGKLGVSSRVEAAAVAHRLGIPVADPAVPSGRSG